MFDGDADRIGFVSNAGTIIRGDTVTALIAKQLLQQEKGEIFYDVMSTKAVADIAQKSGGTARRTRMGRYFINRELNERGGLFAGEVSGHYMFKEMGGYEMPLLAVAYVLEALEEYADFATMIEAFQTSFKTPIISVKVEDKERSLAKIKEVFGEYEQDFLDGISVYGEDFWLNVRGSNTEHKIRYTVEADTEEKMQEIQKVLSESVQG
jgi:phosphomannomutase